MKEIIFRQSAHFYFLQLAILLFSCVFLLPNTAQAESKKEGEAGADRGLLTYKLGDAFKPKGGLARRQFAAEAGASARAATQSSTLFGLNPSGMASQGRMALLQAAYSDHTAAQLAPSPAPL